VLHPWAATVSSAPRHRSSAVPAPLALSVLATRLIDELSAAKEQLDPCCAKMAASIRPIRPPPAPCAGVSTVQCHGSSSFAGRCGRRFLRYRRNVSTVNIKHVVWHHYYEVDGRTGEVAMKAGVRNVECEMVSPTAEDACGHPG
jgi:hypothetical protein